MATLAKRDAGTSASPAESLRSYSGSTPPPAAGPHARDLVELGLYGQELLRNANSDSTLRAYRTDWAAFATWCASHGVPALPAKPSVVTAYIADLSRTPVYSPTGKRLSDQHSAATIARRLAAISHEHQQEGLESPCGDRLVRKMLKAIRNTNGVAQRRVEPVRVRHLRQIAGELPETLQGCRDKALLLVGYIGALRRSELVALNVDDVRFTDEGMQITIRRSKTDQEGRGVVFGVRFRSYQPTCPVHALKSWLELSGIASGPIFRPINRHGQLQDSRLTSKAVSLIIKRLAPMMGIDPDSLSGHSLRAGMATDLCASGLSGPEIMKRTRHSSPNMLAIYYREADIYAVDYGEAVGL